MRLKFAGLVTAVLLLFGATNSTLAHHSFTVEFDPNKCMDLTGPLTGIEWENPHAWVRLDVKDASGKVVPWRLEMITPNALRRNGTHEDGLREQHRQADAREGLRGPRGCLRV